MGLAHLQHLHSRKRHVVHTGSERGDISANRSRLRDSSLPYGRVSTVHREMSAALNIVD